MYQSQMEKLDVMYKWLTRGQNHLLFTFKEQQLLKITTNLELNAVNAITDRGLEVRSILDPDCEACQ